MEMKILGRKGDALSMNVVGGIIIGVLTLLLLLSIVWVVSQRSDGEFDEKTCQASLWANVNLRLLREEFSEKISCPVRRIKAEGDSNLEQQQIADALVQCHSMFYEGTKELFKDSGVYCHVCSIIEFTDKKQPPLDITKYLASHRAPYPNDDKTYAEYLTGVKIGNPELLSSEDVIKYEQYAVQYKLDPNEKYATVFWYAKGNRAIKDALSAAGIGNYILATSATSAATQSTSGLFAAGLGAYGVKTGNLATLPIGGLGVLLDPNDRGIKTGVGALGGLTLGVAGTLGVLIFNNDFATASSTQLIHYNQDSMNSLGCTYITGSQH